METIKIIFAIAWFAIIGLLLIYFSLKKKKRRNAYSVGFIEHDHKEQHIAFVLGILKVGYTGNKVKELEDLYRGWLAKLTDIREKASIAAKNTYLKLVDTNDYRLEGKIMYDEPETIEGYTVVKDCFSEPFPSLHDMDDWALGIKFTELSTLLAMTEEQKKASILYIKKHFVNHKMTRAIFNFDLYVPKEVMV